MKVIIFGASGMVGQGVLRVCLAAADVDKVFLVGRSTLNLEHPKLDQAVLADLFEIQTIRERLSGYDACFFCLGVSSSGMTEAQYTHVTYDLTLAVASCVARLNPAMVFAYVSGAGTDSSERGGTMWARVMLALSAPEVSTPWAFRSWTRRRRIEGISSVEIVERLDLPLMKRECVYLAVHRFKDSVYYRRIERETFLLLGAMQSGVSVAEAAAKAFEKSRQTPEGQAELLRKSFAHASELGWLCPFRDHDEEPLPLVM